NVWLNSSVSTWTVVSGLGWNGTLTLTAGTLDSSSSNYPLFAYADAPFLMNGGSLRLNSSVMTAGGSWTVNGGTFDAGTSTVSFAYAGSTKIIKTNGFPFFNLEFSNGAKSWALADPLSVSGSLTLTAGTLDTTTNNYAVTVSSNVSFSGG